MHPCIPKKIKNVPNTEYLIFEIINSKKKLFFFLKKLNFLFFVKNLKSTTKKKVEYLIIKLEKKIIKKNKQKNIKD